MRIKLLNFDDVLIAIVISSEFVDFICVGVALLLSFKNSTTERYNFLQNEVRHNITAF